MILGYINNMEKEIGIYVTSTILIVIPKFRGIKQLSHILWSIKNSQLNGSDQAIPYQDAPFISDFHMAENRTYHRGMSRVRSYKKFAPMRTISKSIDTIFFIFSKLLMVSEKACLGIKKSARVFDGLRGKTDV